MAKCKHETKNGRCGLKESYAYRRKCYTEECCRCHEPIEPCGRNEPMTNADRIRAMTDRELAEFLSQKCADIQAQQLPNHTATQLSSLSHTWYCAWMQWLQQPTEGE